MSASTVLLVAVSIVTATGTTATIDAGMAQRLEPGDRGTAFYELMVDGDLKRIEVGPVLVAAVGDSTATLTSEVGTPLRPGYQAELRLPVDRMPRSSDPPGSVPNDDPEPISPALTAPTRPMASAEPPEPTLLALPVELDRVPDDQGDQVSEPAVSVRNVVTIPVGRYAIGLDPSEAQFFDQTPRHEVELAGFTIDRHPVPARDELGPSSVGEPLTGLTFAEAQAYCENLVLRLPTEQEWEVATRQPDFDLEPGLFEWTASWYQAYPGNSRDERGYGETSRVLRGVADGSAQSFRGRRFMDPGQRNSRVGFRCVKDFE